MSLFKNIFGSSEGENQPSKIEWRQLTDLVQLNEIVDLSNEKAVLIFKHSTRCSISRFALKDFENSFNLVDKMVLYFLDLLNYREISNEIATKFEVMHQSPQILVIKNGKAVYTATHENIDASILERFL